MTADDYATVLAVDPRSVELSRRVLGHLAKATEPTPIAALALALDTPVGTVCVALRHLALAGVLERVGPRAVCVALPAVAKPKRKAKAAANGGPQRSALDVTHCPSCLAPMLTGRCLGLDERLDTDPLTKPGAIAALAAGHRLFVVHHAERWLPLTDAYPADVAVHRTHACERPPPPPEHRRPIPGSQRGAEGSSPTDPPY